MDIAFVPAGAGGLLGLRVQQPRVRTWAFRVTCVARVPSRPVDRRSASPPPPRAVIPTISESVVLSSEAVYPSHATAADIVTQIRPPADSADAAKKLAEATAAGDAPSAGADAPTNLAYLWPRGLALLVAILWSSNFAAVKLIGQTMPPADGALARFAVAAAAFAPALFLGPKKAGGVAGAREAAVPAGLGFQGLICGLWVSLGYLTQAIALQTTDAGKGAFICSLAVVFVPLVTSLVPSLQSEQKTSKPSWGAAALAALGVGFMELTGVDAGIHSGDLWALLMMAGFGMVCSKAFRLLARRSVSPQCLSSF
jgi:EamA-like transporter family